jgi:hypothetical protein
MQLELQHVDPHADPHDVIAAQLRNLAPRGSQADVTATASPEPVDDPGFRAAPLNDNTGDIGSLVPRAGVSRGLVGLIVCGGIAAAAVWHSYGENAKQRLSHLVPQFLASTIAPTQNAAADSQDAASQVTASQPAADPALTQDTAAAAPATPPEPATPAEPAEPATASSTPSVEPPPAQAALTPELAQSIATMTREIASLKQTVEQLQNSQQQLSRDVAKVTEETRRKPVAQTAKPIPPQRPQRAASTPAPVTHGVQPPSRQAYPQGQTYPQSTSQRDAYVPPAPPQQSAPTQLPPPPGDTSVPRPPMPLR